LQQKPATGEIGESDGGSEGEGGDEVEAGMIPSALFINF
jgi:hypothetical protein